MEKWIEMLGGMSTFSIFIKLVIAVICGGVIGSERGRKGRPAGFRTHILVCLGSALAMMTNEYIVEIYGVGDPARFGAQVISGIGFLGAGTIIVTGKHQVKGLTTAAGLWASACMGLAIGIGFYQGALLACFFIWFVTVILHDFDSFLTSNSKVVQLYVEFENVSSISLAIAELKQQNIRITELEITKVKNTYESTVAAIMTLRLEEKQDHSEIKAKIGDMQGVRFVEGI